MREESFELPVEGGAIRGHRAGEGRAALLLHGGAAVPDYLGECAEQLDGLFSTIRYTQRGTPPSEAPGPYTIEAHMADALAVLDSFGLERAWAVGHSWGGHLAFHLLVAHPDRIAGVLAIDPLGADRTVLDDFEENLGRVLTEAQMSRIRELDERRRAGELTEAELLERFGLIWLPFFAHPEVAGDPPVHVGVQASIGTNRSISEHFERGTLGPRSRRRARPGALRARRGRPVPVARVDRHRRADPGCRGRDHPRLRPLPLARAACGLPRGGRETPL